MSGPTPNAYPPMFQWATAETSYPAGGNPWNATPVVVAPAGDIFTPNTKPSAQNLNYVLNKLTAGPIGGSPGNDVGILQATALVQAQNFQAASLASSLTGGANPATNVDCVGYDAVNDIVMIGGRSGSFGAGIALAVRGDAVDPFAQPAGGNWNELAASSYVTSVLKDPSDSTTYYVGAITSTGATITKVTSAGVTSPVYGQTDFAYTDVKLAYINGRVVAALAVGASPASSYIISSSNQGNTWSARFNVTATFFQVGTSPTPQYVAIGGAAASAIPTETTSSDGVTFTTQPSGFSSQITATMSAFPFGITWGSDASGTAWFLGFRNTLLAKAAWLRSGDGVTWTTTSGSVSTANWNPAFINATNKQPNLASIGGLLESFALDASGNLRLIYSPDGAQTWWLAPFRQISPTAGGACLAAGPTRLIGCVNANSGSGIGVWISSAQGRSTLQAT